LVEGGDLTVRDGRLFLKTLRGLQPIEVLLRGVPGGSVDPLELEPGTTGVPGLLAAARDHVTILNSPGSGLVEAPALAAFLPDLAPRLIGQPLALPSVETLWLDDAPARARVLANPADWCLRPALDAAVPPVALAGLSAAKQREWTERVETTPWRYVATARVTPSMAPCLEGEGLTPRPVLVRMFLVQGRHGWRAMQGALGCVLAEDTQSWPTTGPLVAKDVWILARDPDAVEGAVSAMPPPLAIRRTAGDLPSRIADNFFWLGRYLELLEGAA